MGAEILIQNWLLISILTFFFFFGDIIYLFIKNLAESQSDNKIGSFLIILICVIILSAIPLILSQILMDFVPLRFIIIGIVILFGICFYKHYIEERE